MADSVLKPSKLGVGFTEAIKMAYDNYATFSGRSSRSEYWWFALYEILVIIGLAILAGFFSAVGGKVAGVSGLATVLVLLFYAANFIPGLALSVRRLHDTGRSGWWYLICLIPYLGGLILFVFMVLETEEYENEYGAVEGMDYPWKYGEGVEYGQVSEGPANQKVTCPGCMASVDEEAKFCPECGTAMPPKRYCSACGSKIKSIDKFCPNCGNAVADVAAPQAPLSQEQDAPTPQPDVDNSAMMDVPPSVETPEAKPIETKDVASAPPTPTANPGYDAPSYDAPTYDAPSEDTVVKKDE